MTSHEARTNAARVAANRSPVAVRCRDVSKVYKQFRNPRDMLFDQLGLRRLQFWKRSRAPQLFAALSNLNLVVRHGERLGVIGRNGAGKTTLLKAITGATEPSSGELTLGGSVQALMQIGIGFHPDFTGIENIRASLLYSELTPAERREAEEEIIDFVELGDFLAQPVRTYSLGMKSRLQFACATAIKPDILVIDEILGAGDAYFSAKSAERMRKLTGSGCTLILVSHSMSQVLQFCERAVWLECGRIQAEGEAGDVVKRYEKFTYELRKRTRLTDVDAFEFSRASNWQQNKVREALTASTPTGDHDPSGRWDVENSPIEITRASLLDQNGADADLFRVGKPLIIRIGIRAIRGGRFPCRFAIVIYSSDGRVIGRPCSDWYRFDLAEGESSTIQMVHDPLLLGTGRYFFSCAVYERLDLNNPADAKWYDLLARAIDFEIAGDEADPVPAFHHPAKWSLVGSPGDPRSRT